MKKQITINNCNFNLVLEKDAIKKLQSEIEIFKLSNDYYLIKKGSKIFELVINKDELGNLIINHNGNIFFTSVSNIISENDSHTASNLLKEIIIKSPMPGLISKIRVNVGEYVKKGNGLLIIEAMKMENEIKSPINGSIQKINVLPGQVVEKNSNLIIIKSE